MLYKSGEIVGFVTRHLPGGMEEVNYGGTLMVLPAADNELKNDPRNTAYLDFHVSHKDNRENILKNGLLKNEDPGVVWLSDGNDLDDFINDGYYPEWDKQEDRDVWEVRIPREYFKKLRSGYQLGYCDNWSGYKGNIPPEWLTLSEPGKYIRKMETGGVVKKVPKDTFIYLGRHIKKIMNSDEGYELLDSDKELKGSTWSAGGCYPLALAIKKVVGGDLKMIVEKDTEIVQHILVGKDGNYMDADGLSDWYIKIKIQREEGAVRPEMTEFNADQYGLDTLGLGERGFVDKVAEFIIKKLPDAKTIMASNGKPSNLPAPLWDRVRTNQFKDWFGDWQDDPANASKVVDENGEPAIMYHATNNDFSTFRVDSEMGAHFGNLKQATTIAEKKLDGKYYRYGVEGPNGQNIMPCFISIKNPLRTHDFGSFSDIPRMYDLLLEQNVITKPQYDKINKDSTADELKSLIISKGYDGIIYENHNEGLTGGFRRVPTGDSYIAFFPEQVKSAISNTTFDKNNPDIRLKAGGQLQDINELLGFSIDEFLPAAETHSGSDVQVMELNDIYTDEARFQNREQLNQQFVNEIAKNWSDANQDPIHIWEDPKDDHFYVLSGHHRYYGAKQAHRESVKIIDRTNDFNEAQAIKYAREEANVNRTMETAIERAKALRIKRQRGDSQAEINKFLEREGKNRTFINNISALYPKGKTLKTLEQFGNSDDKQIQKETEQRSDWIGEARRTINGLTDAHENELFDFLFDKDASKRISSKAEFLQKVRSVVKPMEPDEPLNIARFKLKTQGESSYEELVNEKRAEIADRQEKINQVNERFNNPMAPGYISTSSGDYASVRKVANEKISRLEAERKHLQKQLEDIYRDKMKYVGSATTGSLFAGFAARYGGRLLFKSGGVLKEAESLLGFSIDEFITEPVVNKSCDLQDYGEKIGGAKKDIIRELCGITEGDLLTQPLSKAFPEPDYASLVEEGTITIEGALLLKFIYKEIPPKPRRPYRIATWVINIQKSIELFTRIIQWKYHGSEVDVVQEVIEQVIGKSSYRKEQFDIFCKTMIGLGFPENDVKLRGYYIWHFGAGFRYNSKSEPIPETWSVKDETGHIIKDCSTMDEAITTLKEILETNKGKAKPVKLMVYQERSTGKVFIGKKEKGQRTATHVMDGFWTAKEAFMFMDEHPDQLQQIWDNLHPAQPRSPGVIVEERRATNRERIGTDWREGKNITSGEFATTFGFRGVEFGNWVNTHERQMNINEAYDALMDLAAVTGMSPKALSLSGQLAFAFGARGSGRANAHYEPDKIVINLTKTRGAGSLGHEWWHSLDNYFSRMRGFRIEYITNAPWMLTNRQEELNIRKEVLDAYKSVMNAIHNSGMVGRSLVLDRSRTKSYWSTPVEMSARAFENYLITKLAESGQRNDYLANFKEFGEWIRNTNGNIDAEKNYPYPLEAETPAIDQAYQQFFDTLKVRSEGDVDVIYEKGGEIYWRGSENGPEIGKGDFGGIWLAKEKNIAAQYGDLYKFRVNSPNLLNWSSAISRELEIEFNKRYPEEEQYSNQDGEWTELWMFPPPKWIEMLKEKGYDGYVNGSDTFIFNLKKVSHIKEQGGDIKNKYPNKRWVTSQLRNNLFSRVNYPVLDAFIVGSEAKGTAKEDSDLDIAVIIPQSRYGNALQKTVYYQQKFRNDAQKPNWNGRIVDFQFFYPDDPELATYNKIYLEKDREIIMGVDSLLQKKVTTSENIKYELFKSVAGPAIVRISDKDSGNIISLKKYPSFEQAETEFNDLLEKEIPNTMNTGYDARVQKNLEWIGTPREDWAAVPILGFTSVEGPKGKDIEMPVFDFPKGYAQSKTLYKSTQDSPCCELCGKTPIKIFYHIQNDKQKTTLIVGSECVGHFQEGKSGKENLRDTKLKLAILLDKDLQKLAAIVKDKMSEVYTERGYYSPKQVRRWKQTDLSDSPDYNNKKLYEDFKQMDMDITVFHDPKKIKEYERYTSQPKLLSDYLNHIRWDFVYGKIPAFGWQRDQDLVKRNYHSQETAEKNILTWFKKNEAIGRELIEKIIPILKILGKYEENVYNSEYLSAINFSPDAEKMLRGGNLVRRNRFSGYKGFDRIGRESKAAIKEFYSENEINKSESEDIYWLYLHSTKDTLPVKEFFIRDKAGHMKAVKKFSPEIVWVSAYESTGDGPDDFKIETWVVSDNTVVKDRYMNILFLKTKDKNNIDSG